MDGAQRSGHRDTAPQVITQTKNEGCKAFNGGGRRFPYSYYPLSDSEIRILVLLPATDAETPVTCDLEVVSLQHNDLPYEALSYTWGPPFEGQCLPDQSIQLCGQPTAVTGNLFAALKRLRYSDKPRTLWVDALCVNQKGTNEQSHQVSIVGSI